ncbi:Uncharacterised protein [uncultured archaeon]|nr:Uncharacterised protein [uncultured archaeon]
MGRPSRACPTLNGAIGCARRAQASVETLLVFLVFLMVLGIAYLAATRIASASQHRLDYALSESSFADFSSAVSQACALGNGNVRSVQVQGAPASVAVEGKSAQYSAGGFSANASSGCAISGAASAATVLRVENADGKILVRGS